LTIPNIGKWSVGANGSIVFERARTLMAQMVTVQYSVKDQSGSVSNRATLTIGFKPVGMVMDPMNMDMTRKPVLASNVQIVVSGKPVTIPLTSDINL
jgi:hypothetical protein